MGTCVVKPKQLKINRLGSNSNSNEDKEDLNSFEKEKVSKDDFNLQNKVKSLKKINKLPKPSNLKENDLIKNQSAPALFIDKNIDLNNQKTLADSLKLLEKLTHKKNSPIRKV